MTDIKMANELLQTMKSQISPVTGKQCGFTLLMLMLMACTANGVAVLEAADSSSPLATSSSAHRIAPSAAASPQMAELGDLLERVQQQPSRLLAPGQKESELAMNPEEVYGSSFLEPQQLADVDLIDEETFDKRAKWTNLQGGWGKRANNWNKLSAAWGKRGPNGWNNLSGMWGKKRAKWNELSGMWGKRSWNDISGGWGKRLGKRSSSPHWNKLRGMWGKRSAVAPLAILSTA